MARGSDQKREPRPGRARALARRVGSLYLEVLRVYRTWWLRIFLIALAVFLPVAVLEIGLEAVSESIHAEHPVEAFALLGGVGVVAVTSLLGEVFLAGVIGISLSEARDGKFPSIGHIARRIKYLRLIVLDILFAVLVLIGFVFLVVPGVLLYVLLGLGGPVVEIEHRRVWAAFRRSASLVRVDFWLVFWTLIPVGVIANSLSNGLEHMVTAALGHDPVVTGLASAVSEAAFSPLFAISAVLLTLRLIDRKDSGETGLRNDRPEATG